MTPEPLKRRLTAADAVFLYWEHPTQPMHVGECMIYAGKFTRNDVIRMLEVRMHLLPRYRQKVVFPPLGIAHPTWEDDPDFDLRNHVDELTLPAPGDDRVVSVVGGRLMGQLLERDRPLWHVTVLHGHEAGHTIIFLKLHHAMVDGVSSVDLIEVLHDLDPDAPPPEPPADAWRPKPVPGTLSLLRDAVGDQIGEVVKGGRDAVRLLRPGGAASNLKQLRVLARTVAKTAPMALRSPPETPFNRPISAAREFAWLDFPFEDVRTVKGELGGTVNDLVLTVLSGGIARYMRRHGRETEGVELRSLCPVSMRRVDEKGALGNLVSFVVAPLFVGIDDPRERLQAERDAMERLKREEQASGLYDIMRLSHRTPPMLHGQMWKRWPTSSWPLNIVSTNVPGPKAPLYLDGHELLHWVGLGIPWTSLGLFLCTLSYRGTVTLGFVVDPEIVPDVWDVIEDMRAAYQELQQAAANPDMAGVRRA